MNNWTFTGNLGKDCELKVTGGGLAICSFSVAVKSGVGDKAKTTWVKCGLFGKRAEGDLPKYLVKGAQVCISGEAFLDEWDKEGVTNKMLKLNVDKLTLIGGKPQGQQSVPQQQPQQNAPQQQYQQPQPQASQQPVQQTAQQPTTQQPTSGFDDFDDDIPF